MAIHVPCSNIFVLLDRFLKCAISINVPHVFKIYVAWLVPYIHLATKQKRGGGGRVKFYPYIGVTKKGFSHAKVGRGGGAQTLF